MSDLLALAFENDTSDLHLRVGEPSLYRVDGQMIRAKGPPMLSKDMLGLISAFTPEEIIRIVREIGQADFGVAWEKQRFRANVFRAEGEWAAVLRRIPETIPILADILAPPGVLFIRAIHFFCQLLPLHGQFIESWHFFTADLLSRNSDDEHVRQINSSARRLSKIEKLSGGTIGL